MKSRQRFRSYLGWLLATVGVIVAACFAVNCLVDPLWYLRGNVLTGVNFAFNERLAGIIRFLPRLADYDCVVFGTSRSSLLPDENIAGYRCYNLSISDGTAPEYVLYAKYLRERGYVPRLMIVDVKRAEVIGPQQAVEVPDFIRSRSSPAICRSTRSISRSARCAGTRRTIATTMPTFTPRWRSDRSVITTIRRA